MAWYSAFENIASAINGGRKKDGKKQRSSFMDRVEDFVDPFNIFHGASTEGPDLNSQLQEQGDFQAQNQAVQSYNDAIKKNELDYETSNEVFDLLTSGDPSDGAFAGQVLADARAGKGIYAVRKINQNQRMHQIDQPGRAQLSPKTRMDVAPRQAHAGFYRGI